MQKLTNQSVSYNKESSLSLLPSSVTINKPTIMSGNSSHSNNNNAILPSSTETHTNHNNELQHIFPQSEDDLSVLVATLKLLAMEAAEDDLLLLPHHKWHSEANHSSISIDNGELLLLKAKRHHDNKYRSMADCDSCSSSQFIVSPELTAVTSQPFVRTTSGCYFSDDGGNCDCCYLNEGHQHYEVQSTMPSADLSLDVNHINLGPSAENHSDQHFLYSSSSASADEQQFSDARHTSSDIQRYDVSSNSNTPSLSPDNHFLTASPCSCQSIRHHYGSQYPYIKLQPNDTSSTNIDTTNPFLNLGAYSAASNNSSEKQMFYNDTNNQHHTSLADTTTTTACFSTMDNKDRLLWSSLGSCNSATEDQRKFSAQNNDQNWARDPKLLATTSSPTTHDLRKSGTSAGNAGDETSSLQQAPSIFMYPYTLQKQCNEIYPHDDTLSKHFIKDASPNNNIYQLQQCKANLLQNPIHSLTSDPNNLCKQELIPRSSLTYHSNCCNDNNNNNNNKSLNNGTKTASSLCEQPKLKLRLNRPGHNGGKGPTFWGMWEDERSRMVYVSWLPRAARARDRAEKKKCELALKEFITKTLGFSSLQKVLLFPPSSAHCKLLFETEEAAVHFLNTFGGLEGSKGPSLWKAVVCQYFSVNIRNGIHATRVRVIWADQTKNDALFTQQRVIY